MTPRISNYGKSRCNSSGEGGCHAPPARSPRVEIQCPSIASADSSDSGSPADGSPPPGMTAGMAGISFWSSASTGGKIASLWAEFYGPATRLASEVPPTIPREGGSEKFRDLHGIQRSALQQLIARDPKREAVLERAIFSQTADLAVVEIGRAHV